MKYKDLTSIDRIGILGGSGSGKSHTAYVFIKELRSKKYPVWILDISNDFGDLGKNKKKFKTLNAHKITGGLLPQKLRRTKQSVIVKFTRMKSIQDKRKWISSFIDACFDKINDNPAMIVIDEVHRFCPQKEPKDKDQKVCRDWVNELLSDGRKHGYGSMIITQRTAKLDKNALAECKRVFVGRHTLKNDLDSLNGYLGEFPIDVRKEIPRMKVGEVLDVNFEDFTIDRYKIKLDRTKKLGRTPKARGVDPVEDNFSDRIKDFDLGIDREEKIIALGVGVLLIAIIIIVGIAFKLKNDEIIDTDD